MHCEITSSLDPEKAADEAEAASRTRLRSLFCTVNQPVYQRESILFLSPKASRAAGHPSPAPSKLAAGSRSAESAALRSAPNKNLYGDIPRQECDHFEH